MLISGSDYQKNKVHGFWECFFLMFLVWTMVLFLQWCFFSFLYWLKSPFKVAPMNSKRKSHFPSWIPTKHTKIHTDNLCQCQHTYVRSFLNFFNDFFWGTKNHIRPVLEYIAQISQIPLVLCYEGRTSRTLLRRYILHLRLPQGREFVHYLKKIKIP